MSRIGIALLALAVLSAIGYADAACSDESYKTGLISFLNSLKGLISDEFDAIKTDSSYLSTKHEDIKTSFINGGCPNEWPTTLTAADEYTSLAEFLRTFIDKDGESTPEALRQSIKTVEEKLWLIMRDNNFAQCFINNIRDNVLTYLAETCHNKPQMNPVGSLQDFIPPVYYNDAAYETKLKKAAMLAIRGYLTSTKCGSLAATEAVATQMSINSDLEICDTADSTFSTACVNRYYADCPKTRQCLRDLVDSASNNQGFFNDVIFGGDIKELAKQCGTQSKQAWGNSKPKEVPTFGNIVSSGLAIKRAIDDAKKVLTPEQKADFMSYTQTIVKAHIRSEGCECADE